MEDKSIGTRHAPVTPLALAPIGCGACLSLLVGWGMRNSHHHLAIKALFTATPLALGLGAYGLSKCITNPAHRGPADLATQKQELSANDATESSDTGTESEATSETVTQGVETHTSTKPTNLEQEPLAMATPKSRIEVESYWKGELQPERSRVASELLSKLAESGDSYLTWDGSTSTCVYLEPDGGLYEKRQEALPQGSFVFLRGHIQYRSYVHIVEEATFDGEDWVESRSVDYQDNAIILHRLMKGRFWHVEEIDPSKPSERLLGAESKLVIGEATLVIRDNLSREVGAATPGLTKTS